MIATQAELFAEVRAPEREDAHVRDRGANGVALTPTDRARLYNAAFPNYPAVWSDKDWLMGMWCMGNNYQGSGYYGAYPPSYVKRVLAMFPDDERILHCFSGSLPEGPYVRIDLRR